MRALVVLRVLINPKIITTMKKYLLSTFAIVALLFAACGGGDDAPTSVPVSGIKLDKSSLSLEIGEKATLTATIAPSDATNKSITWSSANSSIATVNNGVVEGVATGETTITAKTNDGGFTATIPVKVVTEKVAVEELIIIGGGELQLGEKCVMGVRIKPSNATNQKVSFTCSPELVSIEENIENSTPGMIAYDVTPLGEGEVTFTAVSEDGGITATKNIAVSAPKGPTKVTEIKIGPENATIELGETEQFAVAISPADAENKEVEWSSSDTAVATIDANGLVTGVGKGTATITATAKDGSGVKASTTITVMGPIPTRITFDGATTYEFDSWQGKVIDFKKDLKMKVEPADADLEWIDWGISIQSARPDVSGEEVKYEVKDNNVTLSYAHSTKWVAKETVEITAIVNGNTLASASINFINRGVLFFSATNSYFYDLAMQGNKMNWEKASPTKLKFICYNKIVGSGSIPSYNNYKIPASEYTLTSSDESKIKVTRNDDGESWMIERLNTTDLVAVTLTYKCGEHTQTYTINLIP